MLFRIVLALITVSINAAVWAAPYKLDESHTQVGFKIKHLVISTVSGRFNKFSGSFDFDPAKGEIKDLKVEIEASSIDTTEPDRDKHLKSVDFFDVEKYPKLTFVSAKTVTKANQPTQLEGALTIHGIKKNVTLELDYKGATTDPWGNERIAFEASTKVNRKDFDLKWNKSLDKGGVMIADEVKILIEGEALLQKPAK
ncbi:unnamed protein product [Rotaria magnacalcarata]|uniref:Lipid/polyisoprenoid-binding YceI-like domain-containing protein n=1 Tax=Rotaria magnacalcarata TaxID=392030 RepID=A0A816N6Y6_9BILA|nr:unnamed protein product [Rotaria magnacalcarata]CAF4249002.1 unnamed protein product [Rotaria magnacalcarata]